MSDALADGSQENGSSSEPGVPGFAGAARRPDPGGATSGSLRRMADEVDALLGLVAGIATRQGSPWAWRAGPEGHGSIVSIADEALRARFEAASRRR